MASATAAAGHMAPSGATGLLRGANDKQTICHATGSASNPYVVITPSVSGVYNAHIAHQHTEDIIPPFTYKGQTYSSNWTAAGQTIFANGCQVAPPPTDVCPNIPGNQATIPPGMVKDASGNCVTPPPPPPTDVCPNIPGNQATIPPGTVKDASGNCVTPPPPPPTDVCPNIPGNQATIPPGTVKDASGNCVTPPPPPPTDVCPNIAGVQETVPPGMVKDGSGNCITPPGPPAPVVDLAVTKLDTPDPVSVGNRLRYTIRVTNRGPGRATSVVVTDVLPGGLTLISADPSQGSCSASGAKVTCRLGTMAVNLSATIVVLVRPTRAGTVVNTARVVGAEGDPNPKNNTSTVTTRVVAPFQPPAAPRCDSVTVGRRTITVGHRTTLRVFVKARGRALARVRVRVRGAGIDLRATTSRKGVAVFSVQARRAGIVTITVANESCQRRIGAISGGQPELTG